MPAVTPPTLTDGEVTVRPLRDTDVPAIVAACQDPEIPRWTRVPALYTVEDAQRFVAIAAIEAASGDGLALAVTHGDDRLVGTVGLMALRGGRGEIGYWTAAEARGRGAASRAVVLLRDWAAGTLGMCELEILAHPANRASQRVAERAGFTPTGARRVPAGLRAPHLVYVWRASSALS